MNAPLHSVLQGATQLDRRYVGLAAVAALAVLSGAGVSIRPEAALFVVAPLAVAVLFVSPAARLGFLVIGGIAVLGPPELTPQKSVYFAGVAACLVVAFDAVTRRAHKMPQELRRLFQASAVAVAMIGTVAVYRVVSGTDPTSVLRDLVPYMFFALAPVFAVDAGLNLSLSRLRVIAAVGLTLGSLSWLLSWSIRRGIFEDVGAASVFGSGSLPIALLILAAVSMAVGRTANRPLWGLIAGIAASSMILSGTRSFILELPAALAAVVMAAPTAASRVPRAVLVGTGVALSAGVVAVLLASSGFDLGLVANRWSLLASAIIDPAADQSLALRLAQTEASQRLFL